jgi:hypothetical protein
MNLLCLVEKITLTLSLQSNLVLPSVLPWSCQSWYGLVDNHVSRHVAVRNIHAFIHCRYHVVSAVYHPSWQMEKGYHDSSHISPTIHRHQHSHTSYGLHPLLLTLFLLRPARNVQASAHPNSSPDPSIAPFLFPAPTSLSFRCAFAPLPLCRRSWNTQTPLLGPTYFTCSGQSGSGINHSSFAFSSATRVLNCFESRRNEALGMRNHVSLPSGSTSAGGVTATLK